MTDPLDAIAKNRETHAILTAQVADIDDTLGDLIRAAFEAGYTGPQIAAVARVSKERTYQIRDGRR